MTETRYPAKTKHVLQLLSTEMLPVCIPILNVINECHKPSPIEVYEHEYNVVPP